MLFSICWQSDKQYYSQHWRFSHSQLNPLLMGLLTLTLTFYQHWVLSLKWLMVIFSIHGLLQDQCLRLFEGIQPFTFFFQTHLLGSYQYAAPAPHFALSELYNLILQQLKQWILWLFYEIRWPIEIHKPLSKSKIFSNFSKYQQQNEFGRKFILHTGEHDVKYIFYGIKFILCHLTNACELYIKFHGFIKSRMW